MSLPIPDIMNNAANALKEAKKVSDSLRIGTANSDINPLRHPGVDDLHEALQKINPDDLMAVLNEVGTVYAGVHNMQIRQVGSRPNKKLKGIDIAVELDYGFGPRMVIVGLPREHAEALVKTMTADLQLAKPNGIITG